MKLKNFFYKMAIRPTILYGSECLTTEKHIQKVSAGEMIKRWMTENTLRDRIMNTFVTIH